jgi:hypothetical protein
MAGQPPEPSFQPTGQDQALTQGRPAWQQPSYPPPAGPPGGQQGYPAPSFTPQDQAYAPPDQAYAPPDQAYAPPDQAYAPQDQGYPQQDQGYGQQDQGYTSLGRAPGQDYQAYQPPTYGAQPGQGTGQGAGTPQWQGIAGVTPATPRSKQRGEKGFLGSLFDFSFTSMVTPKIIKALYILFAGWTGLWALIFVLIAINERHSWGTAFIFITLFIIDPIFVLLTLGVYRVVLEAFMVVYRIYEETKKIRENNESRAEPQG